MGGPGPCRPDRAILIRKRTPVVKPRQPSGAGHSGTPKASEGEASTGSGQDEAQTRSGEPHHPTDSAARFGATPRPLGVWVSGDIDGARPSVAA